MRRWRGALLVLSLAAGAAFPVSDIVRAEAAVPACTANECDVPYGVGPSVHQSFDVYYSAKTVAPRPAVLFIHGGGWAKGDKSFVNHFAVGVGKPPQGVIKPKNYVITDVARYLADHYGWLVVSMNYRLGADPNVSGSTGDTAMPYVDQPLDVDAVVGWIKDNAAAYSVAPDRIGLVGASAGAHLALLHAYTHHTGNPHKVKVVASMAGPTDMASLAAAHGCSTANCQDPTGKLVLAFEGGCAPSQCPVRYANTSPVTQIQLGDPATLLAQGLQDPTVPPEQAVEMRAQLVAKVITPHEVHFCEDCKHVDIGVYAWYFTESFLAKNL